MIDLPDFLSYLFTALVGFGMGYIAAICANAGDKERTAEQIVALYNPPLIPPAGLSDYEITKRNHGCPIGISHPEVHPRSFVYDSTIYQYRAYKSIAEVLATIPEYERHTKYPTIRNRPRQGRYPVYVKEGDSVKAYWWKDGTTDADLVEIPPPEGIVNDPNNHFNQYKRK